MRDDRARLADIVSASSSILMFTAGLTQEIFASNELLISAVSHKLSVISEAAARVSSTFQQQDPEVPWNEIRGFRNRIVHEYFSLDPNILWHTATTDVPALKSQIEQLIDPCSSV